MRIGLKTALAAAAMTAAVAAHQAQATPDNSNIGGNYTGVSVNTGNLGTATVH